jgi:mono/diheme cytochrome c family protein
MKTSARLGLLVMASLVLASCERAAKNMYDQPRGNPYRESPVFADGSSSRTPPTGSQPYSSGAAAASSSGRQGTQDVTVNDDADRAQTQHYPITLSLLQTGRQQYTVYCMPCHSPVGDGDGRIVQRGFPAPPSYHTDRLRNVPDRHIYDVISNGFGVMGRYGDRIEPADRWAIVAFVRALQLSQHAQVSALPAQVQGDVKQELEHAPTGAADEKR